MKMRRHDRALSTEIAEEILKSGLYGVLSFASEEGGYGLPLSYAYCGKSIWFHGAREGRKHRDMDYDNRVGFVVVDNVETVYGAFTTKYRSVMVFGNLRLVEGPEKIKGLEALIKKYSPDFEEKGKAYIKSDQSKTAVFCLDIDEMTAKGK